MSIYILIVPVLLLAVVATIMGHRRTPGVRSVKTMVTLILTGIAIAGVVRSGGINESPLFGAIPLALGLSAIADWLLAPVDNRATFMGGLIFFLVAYLLYAIVFLAWSASIVFSTFIGTFAAVTGVFVAGAVGVIQYCTLQHLGDELRRPVQIYMIIATLLLVGGLWLFTALGLGFHEELPFSPGSAAFFASGALWIYISDSLIAHNLFRKTLPAEELWIMPTYYIGQISIMMALFGGV